MGAGTGGASRAGRFDEHASHADVSHAQATATHAVARASQRFVYGDYRVVELLGRRNAHESTAQLAAEIVLRTSTW